DAVAVDPRRDHLAGRRHGEIVDDHACVGRCVEGERRAHDAWREVQALAHFARALAPAEDGIGRAAPQLQILQARPWRRVDRRLAGYGPGRPPSTDEVLMATVRLAEPGGEVVPARDRAETKWLLGTSGDVVDDERRPNRRTSRVEETADDGRSVAVA